MKISDDDRIRKLLQQSIFRTGDSVLLWIREGAGRSMEGWHAWRTFYFGEAVDDRPPEFFDFEVRSAHLMLVVDDLYEFPKAPAVFAFEVVALRVLDVRQYRKAP
jgi:hypothetical protein